MELGLILSDQNSVQTADFKMAMLNRTYPWGFVSFLGTSQNAHFFGPKVSDKIMNKHKRFLSIFNGFNNFHKSPC